MPARRRSRKPSRKRSDHSTAMIAITVFAALVLLLAGVSSQNMSTTGAVTGGVPFSDSSGPVMMLWILALVLLVPVELAMRKSK